MSSISLNLINNSNDKNNSKIVIFQKNVDTSFEELAVAWMVIENCGVTWNHPFSYPLDLYISASDSWGNYSPLTPASNGQQFQVSESNSGDSLTLRGPASSDTEIEIYNGLEIGAFTANAYKNGKLLATKTGIPPGEKAVFEFKPTIWIGVVSQIQEGQVMNSAVLSQVNTELSLFGIASADIIMTGGGNSARATPFQFVLDNIQYA
ncbi:hypothetical protein [Chitinophaga tropicalis]|uniref:Aromatic ring-opening dioxygenase LigA n=1 Tax=Chitinophaga tropicalis TaxID=2683588 RepID=A0A7K1U3Z1_9BACT|nr:hypothetical protein [Chitinophaga tropicalis]MVT09006.1 hypothetical protein [Chitinophaga tropicalis]